ncbi:helix-turn-helix domain-containing protein [Methylovirgula sp. HY1]|uniref:AraC-like ligand-binding domain-containing protein n=1 Tax=Methylovirgula sp. HY1 TaxID=2822761 RepID=UPI001C5BF0F8|nr:helix-turn-helix domain-containing protein [Methylovirgula sp. HY1]QXX76057.1 Transcriptional activator NphR [Methylovirgula sp. HY1]
MQTYFSTFDIHPRDRVEYWRNAASRAFVELDCRTSIGLKFYCVIRRGNLGPLSLSVVETNACEVRRTKREIARTRSDDLLISVQLEGTVFLCQDGREARLDAGDFSLYDASRPYLLKVNPGTRQLVVQVPRELLERRLGSSAAFTARTAKFAAPVAGLASDFLSLLPGRLDALSQTSAAERISGQALDLIALAFSDVMGGNSRLDRSVARSYALLRLKRIIEERLTDPGLKPSLAATLAGVSHRYARELFAEAGTTLGRYILKKRLERCRLAFEDPAQAHRAVGEIARAWGFVDASHFTRVFSAHYGESPRLMRVRLNGK